jgi:hypothetical protein
MLFMRGREGLVGSGMIGPVEREVNEVSHVFR